MEFGTWLQIAFICILGAVSPGPSLAAVVTNTTRNGQIYGVSTAIGHGIGITLWASATAVGVAEAIVYNSYLLTGVQYLGACLLGFIGVRSLRSGVKMRSNSSYLVQQHIFQGLSEGFMIALLNPKIALFFLAIFSQFIIPDSNWIDISLMGITAGIVDALWYVFVAVAVSIVAVSKFLHEKSIHIARVSGLLLILVSVYLAITTTIKSIN